MSDTNTYEHDNDTASIDETPGHPEKDVADASADTTAAEAAVAGSGADAAASDQLVAELAQLKEQLLRRAAEFENFKRRTREEKDLLMKYGAEGVLRDLLPVLDDFDRSIAAAREHNDLEALRSGIEIIHGKLLRVLEHRGLRPIDAMGKPFDVDFHDALLQMPSAEAAPGTVLDVVEKGYMLHDRVIRHAKVTVAAETPAQNTDANA